AEPTGADRFRYEMVTEEAGHERRVELGEGEIPDALRPLLDLLHDHGHVGPPSG
ncbi:MAG: protealysin inhibitor emfourin, partial [Pseudonocardiaceae bacterium]